MNPKTQTTTTVLPRWFVPAIAGTSALIIGLGAGVGIGAATSDTPEACIKALDTSDELIQVFGQTMLDVGNGFDAASRFDAAGIYRASDQIEVRGTEIDALSDPYLDASTECRGE